MEPVTSEDTRLLRILDGLLVGAILIDPATHRIIYVNGEAAAMMGRAPEELAGHVCHQYICPAVRGSCPITDLGQEIDRSERCVLDRTGSRVPILKTVKKIRFDGRGHLLETFMDISALKEKERLQGALEMAGAAAHHLGQPLQILLTSAELIQKPNQPEHIARHLNEKLIEAVDRLKAIVTRIQNITAYETEEYAQGRRIVDIEKSSSK